LKYLFWDNQEFGHDAFFAVVKLWD